MKRDAFVIFVCLCLASCGVFFTKPMLPKQSAGEAATAAPDAWALAVNRADIIYFPVERIGAESGDDSVARVVNALTSAGRPFALAWYGIELEQSGQTPRAEPSWSYTGSLRERCKIVMRNTIEARQLFLGLPRPMREKLQRGAVLDSEEKEIIPRGYRTPAGGLEDFAEQLAAVRGLRERDIENLYRAHLVAAQFAADKIASFMDTHRGEKLLVLARRRELAGECGIPAFVSQKSSVRQIIFDRDPSRNAQPRLVRADRIARAFVRL